MNPTNQLKTKLSNMNKKQKTTAALLTAAVLILASINIYILLNPKPKTYTACYLDLCLHSQQQRPVTHIEETLQQAQKTHIVFEGEENRTEENPMTFQAATKMITAAGRKTTITQENIYVVTHRNNQPIKCENLLDQEFPLKHCQELQPQQNEMTIHLKYPNHHENRVDIENNKITIKTKSPQDLLATATFLEQKFF